jgi:metal-responsive CopG/Arc/MetJ family transcriptional regulator
MTISHQPVHKITISITADLLTYTDEQAQRTRTSRSQFISQALARFQASEEERLAAEGYRFYADETGEFSEVSASAVDEALNYER